MVVVGDVRLTVTMEGGGWLCEQMERWDKGKNLKWVGILGLPAEGEKLVFRFAYSMHRYTMLTKN